MKLLQMLGLLTAIFLAVCIKLIRDAFTETFDIGKIRRWV